MHQPLHQENLLAYWVVKIYDPANETFYEAYKSYGHNVAHEKLVKFLGQGKCAVIEHRNLAVS